MGTILKVMTLWSLLMRFVLTTVNGEGEAVVTLKPREPDSLKEMLDFFEKIGKDTSIRTKVVDKLENKLSEHFNNPDVGNNGFKNNLSSVFDKINELRQKLLNKPDDCETFVARVNDDQCEKYVNQLIHWLPKLRSMLWFLYFKTTTDCRIIGGEDWADNIHLGGGRSTLLQRWLTDQPSEQRNGGILKRGYTASDIKTGVFGASQAHSLGVQLYAGGPLDHAQFGFFLLDGTWSDANLASATLFLREFCQKIQEDNFKGKQDETKYKNIKDVCTRLSREVDSLYEHLWPLFNPMTANEAADDEAEADVPSKKQNKADSHCKVYVDKLKIDKFDVYVTWLTNNLSSVIVSLKEMHKDSSNWSKEYFDNANSIGPFKYGFVFKDKNWDGSIYSQLQSKVDKLKSALLEYFDYYDHNTATKLKEEMAKEEESQRQPPKRRTQKQGETAGPKRPSSGSYMPSSEETKESQKKQSQVNPSHEPSHQGYDSDLNPELEPVDNANKGHSDPSRRDTHSLPHKPSFASFPSVILASAVVVTSALL